MLNKKISPNVEAQAQQFCAINNIKNRTHYTSQSVGCSSGYGHGA
jgi:hypothetical protein